MDLRQFYRTISAISVLLLLYFKQNYALSCWAADDEGGRFCRVSFNFVMGVSYHKKPQMHVYVVAP